MNQEQSARALAIALLLGGVAFALPESADAQTAKNLQCKGCVNSRDIGNGKIKAKDMHRKAKPAGGNYTGEVGSVTISGSDTVVRSVTLNLPGPGLVVVNSGGHMIAESDGSLLRCAIAQSDSGLTIEQDYYFNIGGNSGFGNARKTVGSTRAFREKKAGEHTYQLKCVRLFGTARVFHPVLTAVFVPKIYGKAPEAGEGGRQASDP